MLAWILEYAGLGPGFLVGGVPQNFGISARLAGEIPPLAKVAPPFGKGGSEGVSPFFVIEADEYDTAFFDKRSKFLHYRPRTAVLNNLEFDHADIFPDLAAIETQFHHLKGQSTGAAVTCVLYATSPWIITFGRVAREYAYYPFIFYWIVYAMVLLVQAIPSRFVVPRQWRSLLRLSVVLPAACLVVPPFFALKIGWLSTFGTVLIAYLVLGLFVLLRLDWRAKPNWPFLLAIVAAMVIGGAAWYREQATKLLLVPRVNPVPLSYFFPNPEQQWYFDRGGVVVVLAVVAAVATALLSTKPPTTPPNLPFHLRRIKRNIETRHP